MASSTVVLSGSAPRATARSRSRSVMMPMSWSPSAMISEPVCWRHIRSAADRRLSCGDSVTVAWVMTSLTCTALLLSGCSDGLYLTVLTTAAVGLRRTGDLPDVPWSGRYRLGLVRLPAASRFVGGLVDRAASAPIAQADRATAS